MADKDSREDDPHNRVSSKVHASDDAGNLNEAARNTNTDVQSEASFDIGPGGPTTSFSQASQVGRARTGGSPNPTLEPGERTQEGWKVPDQSDTPAEWPEPTID